jgi:hypothetical protein
MRPLTLDNLLPLSEYAERRREFFDAHIRYLDRCRRVRVGPKLTLVFENRQTLWFRVQELLCIARLQQPSLVQEELDLSNRLLPTHECLQAAMIVAVENEAHFQEELAPWEQLQGEQLCLHLGSHRYPANLFTCRPEDRCVGTTHWVQFRIDQAGRQCLADPSKLALLALHLTGQAEESSPLTEEVRASLLEDLQLSDHDSQAA